MRHDTAGYHGDVRVDCAAHHSDGVVDQRLSKHDDK